MDVLAKVSVPTDGVSGWITPAHIGVALAFLLVGWGVVRVWQSLPKGVLIFVLVLAAVAAGVLSLNVH